MGHNLEGDLIYPYEFFFKCCSSKGNESSLRLELDITPDTKTKIPETQESIEEENIEVTSQSSTIEIESTGTTTEKGTLSPADGCEENSHKTSQQSDVKENIFGKSGQEDDHSLQISQDELFGSHISVVASTPQSNINSRLLLQKEITHIDMGNDDEMIPSSPEEKKKKSSGLSVGQGFLKRERVTLSLGRSSTKAEPSSASPDVVEICDDIIVISPVKNITRKDSELSDTGKRRIDFGAIECQHLESQETIYRGTHDKLESDVTKEKNLTKISGKYKQKLEVSVSTGRESSECGKDLDDDFDTEPVANKQCSFDDNESQETLYKDTEENLTDDLLDEKDNKIPKSGFKRKFEDLKLVEADELLLGRHSSSDDDFEVEVLEVKKPRKSVELLYTKTMSKSSQKYVSPLKKPDSSTQSFSSSSHKSITPKKSDSSGKPMRSNMYSVKKVETPPESEDFVEEEFTLHISPSEESQVEIKNKSSSSSQLEPLDKNSGSLINCGTMSTIMEVDEGCPSEDLSHLVRKELEEIETKDILNQEVAMDCEDVGERSSREVIRPSSPEYLSGEDDGEKSWMGLNRKTLTEKATKNNKEESKKKTENISSIECCSNRQSFEHSKDSNLEKDVPPKEISNGVPRGNKKEMESIVKPISELQKNGTSADHFRITTEIHRWFLVHVIQDVDVEKGQISSTKILELQDFTEEHGKNTQKIKNCGRVSDVSKTSSVDSKSSACLGDISSPPNPISPQSISGDSKLFPLPPTRTSIMSTFSHSSSSTSGSDLAINHPKGKEKAMFTKPYQPLSIVRDKDFNIDDISPDLKVLNKIRVGASDNSSEISKPVINMSESDKLKFEQVIHEYCLTASDSQNFIPKATLEEKTKNLPERRYLTRRSKGKRVPLRMKKKVSSSSKTSPIAVSSHESLKNTEDQDTLPVEESSCEVTSPKTPKVVGILSSLTPKSEKNIRTKESRSSSSRSSQAKSSEPSSENGNGDISLKCDLRGSPTSIGIRPELPSTPRSSVGFGLSRGMLSEGVLAFARFSDKWYYPGKVRQQQKDNRWIVDFDDGDVRSVIEDFIVAVDVLEQGQSVYAAVGKKDAEYEPGIVTKIETKKKQVYYTVELDIGITEVLPRSKLCLTEDQVNIIKELKEESIPSTPKRKADVSLDNILEGKRTRGRKTVGTVDRNTPSTSKSNIGKRPVPHIYEMSSSVSTVSELSESGTGFVNIPGLEPTASPELTIMPGNKGKGPGRKKGRKRQTDTNEQHNPSSGILESDKILPSNVSKSDLGPIPPKGSTLFNGKYFILNYGVNKEIKKQKQTTRRTRTDTSSEGDGTESCEEMHFSITPFVKRHLKKQLEAGGGVVFDRYEDECRGKTCFLISNKCNLTTDYILSLSSDIQSISHDWVINCCIKGELLPWMENLLPVGWSLEEERYVEWHERSSQALKNVEIVLASDSGSQFLEFWRRVLAAAGAHVRKVSSKTMSMQEGISYARVVVTDHVCPAGILDCARETGTPMVSTVWVQQSLIHGKMRPIAGHSSYKYDYRHIE